MKKRILIPLLILALSLCGCGKNEVVVSVEDCIAAIGAVTEDSREAVAAARTAYGILPEKLQEKVENYTLLEEAEAILARLDAEAARDAAEAEAARLAACAGPARWLEGQWMSVDALIDFIPQGFEKAKQAAADNGITFSADGACRYLDTDARWEGVDDNTVVLNGVEFRLDDSSSCPLLQSAGGYTYVRKETMEDMFVAVDVDLSNIGQYAEFRDVTFDQYDSLHQFQKTDKWICLTNPLLKKGLIYFTQSPDSEFVVDIGVDTNYGMPRILFHYTLFGPMSGSFIGMEFYQPFSAATCSFTTAQGTIYYVRSQYAEVSVKDGERTLALLGKPVVIPVEALRPVRQNRLHRLLRQEEYLLY